MRNHDFWSPDCTFLRCLYGGNYIVIFQRFVKWSCPSGRSDNFYQVAQGQRPLLCGCPKSIGSIGDTTIFWVQQYWSCSKSGGCRAAQLCLFAQLLGGFRRNLLIVSWVTATPGCTANFPGNRCSQPLILRPFGRSGPELPVEYQVEALFINFSRSTRVQQKKAIDRGQDLGISENP
jgi:hypothetical protein